MTTLRARPLPASLEGLEASAFERMGLPERIAKKLELFPFGFARGEGGEETGETEEVEEERERSRWGMMRILAAAGGPSFRACFWGYL